MQEILQHSPAKKKKKKTKKQQHSTHQTWCLSLLVLFLSNVLVGDGQESLRMLLRTVPLRRTSRLGQYWQKSIYRCVHHILQHFPTTMGFLTVSAITYSWMASTAAQANSWWFGHVDPDDVVIADIAGQALDIFLHGPESAHQNGIRKTFTHTSIPIHPCTLLKKKEQKQQQQNAQLTKHDAFVDWSSSCAVCWWPIFRKLGTCSTTDALSPRTLLTENICESVQKILQHSPAKRKRKKRFNSPKMMPFFTGPLPVQCPGGQFSGSLAPAPRRTTCRLGHF